MCFIITNVLPTTGEPHQGSYSGGSGWLSGGDPEISTDQYNQQLFGDIFLTPPPQPTQPTQPEQGYVHPHRDRRPPGPTLSPSPFQRDVARRARSRSHRDG